MGTGCSTRGQALTALRLPARPETSLSCQCSPWLQCRRTGTAAGQEQAHRRRWPSPHRAPPGSCVLPVGGRTPAKQGVQAMRVRRRNTARPLLPAPVPGPGADMHQARNAHKLAVTTAGKSARHSERWLEREKGKGQKQHGPRQTPAGRAERVTTRTASSKALKAA